MSNAIISQIKIFVFIICPAKSTSFYIIKLRQIKYKIKLQILG